MCIVCDVCMIWDTNICERSNLTSNTPEIDSESCFLKMCTYEWLSQYGHQGEPKCLVCVCSEFQNPEMHQGTRMSPTSDSASLTHTHTRMYVYGGWALWAGWVGGPCQLPTYSPMAFSVPSDCQREEDLSTFELLFSRYKVLITHHGAEESLILPFPDFHLHVCQMP